ncbi:hypothetical protein SCHPADRAFT_113593 [Schizopora paradoxa]|uniref:Uncharacterized protein n=1 Tax=Schizopora paradoxa TaxID=27342 RepID=A0A0H2S3J3_9AGAM|nr:hypothetical protein SCHPADRAFT_113593 [Schizopora paradoxa]
MSGRRANTRSQTAWRGRGRGRGDSDRGRRGDSRGCGIGERDGLIHYSHSRQKPSVERSLEYLPSISRSGGQGGHGDTLKQSSVQDAYWETIQSKLADHWKRQYQIKDSLRKENESNLLLHLRKLREGIISSKREDTFALAVYELSFYLAILFDSPAQISASQSHFTQLFETLRQPSDFSSTSSLHRKATAFLVTSSLLNLTEGYPSQKLYYRDLEDFKNLPQSPNDKSDVDCQAWIRSLRSSLNMRNYVQSQHLTSFRRVNSIVDRLIPSESQSEASINNTAPLDDLLGKVIFRLIDSLREKLRESAWQVLRAAYRELTVSTANDVDLANSAWVGRALFFDIEDADKKSMSGLENWKDEKVGEDQLIGKAGMDGRWMICRNKK